MLNCSIRKSTVLITIIAIVMTFFFIACKEGVRDSVDYKFDPETVPLIHSEKVDTYISDSGIMRYRLIADIWDMYDKAKEPFWFFPEKVHLEQFDTSFQIVATIDADTAWYFTKKSLWQLRGNVFIKNNIGETFQSEELFFNQRTERVYSQKYVKVVRPGEFELQGDGGFEANMQMTEYTFYRVVDSPINVKEKEEDSNPVEEKQE